MQIECMVIRPGLTVVDIKERHIQFHPIPGSDPGEPTTSMADIADPEDEKYLLSRRNFRPYNQEQAMKDLFARRKKAKENVGRFIGYSIEKLVIGGMDRGYMLVDYRNKAPMFCGNDGQWTQDYQKVMPFKDQSGAGEYLTHIVPGKADEDRGRYACQVEGCTRKFETAIGLADHVKSEHKEKAKKE